jgi:Phage ABA sandwich domain
MKPGLDLDLLIAQRVMGIKTEIGEEVEAIHTIPHFGRVTYGYLPLPYSTDIAAAWEVVEKMKVGIKINGSVKGKFQVLLINESGTDTFEGFSNTVPHAICLAALKAVGVEK